LTHKSQVLAVQYTGKHYLYHL